MNKGICYHFGYVYKDIEKQVKDIKKSGFNCVMTTADPTFNKDNRTIKKQVKLFKKLDSFINIYSDLISNLNKTISDWK